MRLVLSGGGTGGHIIPNIALIHELRVKYPEKDQLQMLYIGTTKGMEKQMIEALDVPYVGLICGKLRRYFSLRNLIDFFKMPIGLGQAFWQLSRFKPDVIFCKGGYVCFPVAVAGWFLHIPVILHEADVVPGLANKLCARFATIICVAFEESKRYFKHKKVVVTGNPIRRELMYGNQENGLHFLDFQPQKPILLFIGGSLGATFLNETVWRNLDSLLPYYQVAHICGKGKVKDTQQLLTLLKPEHRKYIINYRGFSFLDHELKDLYATANVVISRAGALSLAEIDFFQKPTLLIPLSKKASRGDQIENAQAFAKNHRCVIFEEHQFEDDQFLKALKKLVTEKSDPVIGNNHHNKFSALEKIIHLLEKA